MEQDMHEEMRRSEAARSRVSVNTLTIVVLLITAVNILVSVIFIKFQGSPDRPKRDTGDVLNDVTYGVKQFENNISIGYDVVRPLSSVNDISKSEILSPPTSDKDNVVNESSSDIRDVRVDNISALTEELFWKTSTDVVRNDVNNTGLYVLGSNYGRLGNQIFAFAFSLLVARRTGRQVVIQRDSLLDDTFQTASLKHIDDVEAELFPCFNVTQNTSLALDISIQQSISESTRRSIRQKSIILDGYFSSWSYLSEIEDELRRYLSPKPSVRKAILDFFREVRPRHWTRMTSDRGRTLTSVDEDESLDYRRIGIHIRASDMTTRYYMRQGYRLPLKDYFEQAMMRMVIDGFSGETAAGRREHLSRHNSTDEGSLMAVRRIQFIVATDSILWVRKTYQLESIAADIARNMSSTLNVDIDLAYSSDHSPGFDMLMLSMCDAVVMTQGTFGWWSAWLGNKTAIYYSGSPRKGSMVDVQLRGQKYQMPNWIGIDGPGMEIPSVELQRQRMNMFIFGM